MIQKCKDGTIKYRNPFSGTECWYTPGRRHRPMQSDGGDAKPLVIREPQDYCNFCPAHFLQTTPEKSRLVRDGANWALAENLTAEEVLAYPADFRRIGNLFEIISIDYWKKNYGYALSAQNLHRKEVYLSTPAGREHVLALLHHKLKRAGSSASITLDAADWQAADCFFGGAHDLIIPNRHYRNGATTDAELFSTGEMTPEEHEQYVRLSIHTLQDIYEQNPFVRFVSVYTNWRRDAGATFEHLHRQIIGMDVWGHSLQRCDRLVARFPNCFNDYLFRLTSRHKLTVCENDHAVAVADIGQPFSTIAVFSKSAAARPHEHEPAQVRGVSDVIHSIHAALGVREPCNEEWYYSPRDASQNFPWYVLIKWRKNRHAGIEGATRLYFDVFRPEEIRDMLIERLIRLRREGRIAPLRIGAECAIEKNPLRCFRRNNS